MNLRVSRNAWLGQVDCLDVGLFQHRLVDALHGVLHLGLLSRAGIRGIGDLFALKVANDLIVGLRDGIADTIFERRPRRNVHRWCFRPFFFLRIAD